MLLKSVISLRYQKIKPFNLKIMSCYVVLSNHIKCDCGFDSAHINHGTYLLRKVCVYSGINVSLYHYTCSVITHVVLDF